MSNDFKRVATTSERLKEAILFSGKKQVDISKATGIDKGSISNYISGRYEPKLGAIKKLAEALDVSEMWLWGYDVPKERQKEKPAGEGELSAKKLEFIEKVKQMSEEELERLEQILRIVESTK